MKIAILTTSPKSIVTKKLKEAGKLRGHEMKVYNPEKMYLYISNVHRKDRLYYEDERIYKKDIDCIIPRVGSSSTYCRAIIQHIRQNMGIFSTQTASGISNASNKLKTTQLLSLNGITVPRTIYAKESKNVKLLIEQVGGLPVIVKGLTGSQGANVIILETVLSANSVLESYYKAKQQIIIQEFIEPDKDGAKDIRAIVIGGEVVTAMQRIAPKGSFKANVSLGAEAKPIELTENQKELAIKASEAVGLDISGVDLMTDKDGNNYVIEVNSNQGWKIQDICTDIDIAAEYIKFCEENYKQSDKRDMIGINEETKDLSVVELQRALKSKENEIRLSIDELTNNIEISFENQKRDIGGSEDFKEFSKNSFDSLINNLNEVYGNKFVNQVTNKYFS